VVTGVTPTGHQVRLQQGVDQGALAALELAGQDQGEAALAEAPSARLQEEAELGLLSLVTQLLQLPQRQEQLLPVAVEPLQRAGGLLPDSFLGIHCRSYLGLVEAIIW
jgi:hypothetical protein